jgi:hypothetical protein
MKNEIIIYQPNELTERIEVRVEEETVGLIKIKWVYYLVETDL